MSQVNSAAESTSIQWLERINRFLIYRLSQLV